MMRQHLDSPLGHRLGRDARDGEGGSGRGGCTLDRALHAHQIVHAKTVGSEPPMRLGGVRDGKGCEMDPRMAAYRRIEFAAERSIGGPKQHFEIAA